MPDTLADLVYLDWDRIRALAAEAALAGPASAPEWRFSSAAPSRPLQTALFRELFQNLSSKNKLTAIVADFDYAQWSPTLFADGQLVHISTRPLAAQLRGFVRLLDYPWLSSVMETLPRMLKVSQRAELSALKQKREAHQITQDQIDHKVKEHQAQLKDLENWKMDELTDVVRELFGHSVRLKIIPAGATRGEMFVAACPPGHFLEPPALLSQRYGCDIDAPFHVLGMVNAPAAATTPTHPLPTGNAVEDMFERLALAVNRIHRVASAPDFPALSLTPLAIWREV